MWYFEKYFWTNQEEIGAIYIRKVDKICVQICKKESQRNQTKKEVTENFEKVRIWQTTKDILSHSLTLLCSHLPYK